MGFATNCWRQNSIYYTTTHKDSSSLVYLVKNIGNAFSPEALARDREALRQGQIARESLEALAARKKDDRAHGMTVVSNQLVEP